MIHVWLVFRLYFWSMRQPLFLVLRLYKCQRSVNSFCKSSKPSYDYTWKDEYVIFLFAVKWTQVRCLCCLYISWENRDKRNIFKIWIKHIEIFVSLHSMNSGFESWWFNRTMWYKYISLPEIAVKMISLMEKDYVSCVEFHGFLSLFPQSKSINFYYVKQQFYKAYQKCLIICSLKTSRKFILIENLNL